ncbi:MAG TPA: hypothetical protein VMI11_09355 [Actinomycetes bacterium]|nr:hypothetical protein [Actinomycetes bacterium]
MDLTEVADGLYALPPDAFLTARDALARAAPDRSTAASIRALRKPTVAAWALNHLVRADRESVEQLVGLGAQLRRAHEALAGADLRALGRQRHQLVRAVAAHAAELAAEAGQTLSRPQLDQVTTALDAALTDAGTAAALLAGRLSVAPGYAGASPTGADPVGAGPVGAGESGPAPARPEKSPTGAGTSGPALAGSGPSASGANVVSLVPPPAGSSASSAEDRARASRAVSDAERELEQAVAQRVQAREVLASAHLRAGLAEERLQAAQDEAELARAEEDAAIRHEREATRSEEIATLHLDQARAHAATLGL